MERDPLVGYSVRALGPDDVLHVLAGCSMVVGLHPDQATEEIMNFANACGAGMSPQLRQLPQQVPQQLQPQQGQPQTRSSHDTGPPLGQPAAAAKPFALAPCCVFPRLFAHRRLRGGSPAGGASSQHVRTYPQLVQYCLQQGGPGAQIAWLGFEGANQVVFRT